MDRDAAKPARPDALQDNQPMIAHDLATSGRRHACVRLRLKLQTVFPSPGQSTQQAVGLGEEGDLLASPGSDQHV